MASRRGGHSSAHRYPRVSRVNQVVQEVLAEELERRSDTDERLSLLTVTGVTVDPDLRHAVVYLSSMGQDAADALEEHRVALQAAVGRQTRLKRTPRLSFEVDPAVVHGAAVEEALRRLRGTGGEE
jgi:ribosome-binding factor A